MNQINNRSTTVQTTPLPVRKHRGSNYSSAERSTRRMSENSELEKEKSALALSTDDSDIHGSNDWEVHADMPDMADCEAPHLDSTVKQRSGGSDFAEAECDSATDNSATLASKQETKEEPTIVEDGARPWDFSSRKVMVQGVNKFHDVKTLTKIVNKWLEDIKSTTDVSLAYDKIKKPPKETWMVVTMQAEAMVQPFIDYICTNEIQNKRGGKLFAKLALNESRDNDNRGKRTSRDDHGDEDQTSKRQRVQHARRPITDEELKNKITPLWKLSPEEQLDTKMKEMIKKCAMKIMNEIKIKFR